MGEHKVFQHKINHVSMLPFKKIIGYLHLTPNSHSRFPPIFMFKMFKYLAFCMIILLNVQHKYD